MSSFVESVGQGDCQDGVDDDGTDTHVSPNGCSVRLRRAQLALYECLQVPLIVERDVTVDLCACVYRW